MRKYAFLFLMFLALLHAVLFGTGTLDATEYSAVGFQLVIAFLAYVAYDNEKDK